MQNMKAPGLKGALYSMSFQSRPNMFLGVVGAMFRKAVDTKLANLHATGAVTHMLWDRLVFSKVGEGRYP